MRFAIVLLELVTHLFSLVFELFDRFLLLVDLLLKEFGLLFRKLHHI